MCCCWHGVTSLFTIQSCDPWPSLCHPMPGLIQKGLGRQRDAQSSSKHLTIHMMVMYCTINDLLIIFQSSICASIQGETRWQGAMCTVYLPQTAIPQSNCLVPNLSYISKFVVIGHILYIAQWNSLLVPPVLEIWKSQISKIAINKAYIYHTSGALAWPCPWIESLRKQFL